MEVKEVTVSEGLESIRTAFASYMDGALTREQADKVGYVILNEIALRDFLVGLPIEHGSEYVGGFIEEMLSDIDIEYAHPLLTILAMLYMEVGEREKAWLALEESRRLNSDYSLTHAITRVYFHFGAEEVPALFASMRDGLHSKVLAQLLTTGSQVIEVSNG